MPVLSIDPRDIAEVMKRLIDAKPHFTSPLQGSLVYDYQNALYRICVGVPGVIREISIPPAQILVHPPGWYWDFAMECFALSLRDPELNARVRALPNLPRYLPMRGVSGDLIYDTRTTPERN